MKARLKPYLHWIILLALILLVIICGLLFVKTILSPSDYDYEQAAEEKSEQEDEKEGTYYVYGGTHGLPLHKEASKHSKIITVIGNGASVEIVTKSYRGYYKIQYKKQEGYVKGRYLLKYNQEAGSKLKERLTSDYPLYYVVNCEGHVNMYRRRNSSSKVIAKVEFGYRVRLLEKGRNHYYKVAYRNKIGYIESKYLSKYKHES